MTDTPTTTAGPVEDELDIVEELTAWADIVDGAQGAAHVVMLSGAVFRAAAAEISQLREQLGARDERDHFRGHHDVDDDTISHQLRHTTG